MTGTPDRGTGRWPMSERELLEALTERARS
jgi:hypothetical protein